MIYQFAHHSGVKSEPPECEAAELHKILASGKELTREQKDRLAQILYGIFGAASSSYKLAGWSFSFGEFLPMILVKQHGDWHEYYAPDKTSLRKALNGQIQMMVLVEREHK